MDHYLLDVMRILERSSSEFQRRYGLVIGQEHYKDMMISGLKTLKTQDGESLEGIERELQCSNGSRIVTPCDAEMAYSSLTVKWQNIELNQGGGKYPKLSEVRTRIIDNLVEELKSYFPEGDLKEFDILDPVQIPRAGS